MEKLFNLYIENLETSIKLIDVIIPVIKTFDGKVYNKRFQNKVDEAILKHFNNDVCKTVYFYPEIDNASIHFSFKFFNNRSVQGKSCWNYLPDSYTEIEILRYYRSNNEDIIPFITYDNNFNIRLNTGLIVQKLTEEKTEIKDKIEYLKEEVKKVADYKKQLEEIQKAAKNLRDSIPYEIKDLFNIKCWDNWS